VILIHGGSWQIGDKSWCGESGIGYARAGIAAFSINYRLSGEATYPAAVADCVSAVRWVRSHAAEYRVAPDRLGVEGVSAGGHLALMVGLMEPDPGATDSHGRPLRNWVRCIISQVGPTDLTDRESFPREADRPWLGSFIGGLHADMPDKYREASPVTYVSADDPPVMLLHGTADTVVPYRQAVIMQKRLREAGVPVELVTVEGGEHIWTTVTTRDERIALRQQANAFMAKHLADR
jgi:acetyl esterase/lipase